MGPRAPQIPTRPSVALSTLAACAASFLLPSVAHAEQDALPAVTVTATRSPARVDSTVAEVTVIPREDIERATGRTLPELLADQPGLQFNSNGGLGKSSSIFIQGLEARHTLLLVDGVRYGSATTGTPVLDNFSLDEIERIEIVRGPLSSLYGSDAVGGVIQIFTRRGRPGTQANGAVTLGGHSYSRVTAGLGFGDDLWDVAVQAAHVENGGISATNPRVQFGNFNADPDGFHQDSANVQVGLKLGSQWRLGAKAQRANGVTGIDDGLGANALIKLGTEIIGLDLTGSPLPGWQSTTRVSRSTDKSNSLVTASPFTDLGTFKTVQEQASHEQTVETSAGTVLAVVDFLKQKVSKPAAQYDVVERNILGFAAGLNGQRGAHTWQGSVRHDRNSQFGEQTTGALGYGFDPVSWLRLGGSYGTSFVAPSFNQLYYPGFGNPDLLPEEGKSAELSVRIKVAAHQVRLAWFQHRIRGYISSGPQPVNVPNTEIDGVTLSYEGRAAGLKLAGSVDHVDPRNKTAGANYDKLLPRRASDSGKFSVFKDMGAFGAGVVFRAVGDRYDNAANTLKVAGYGTFDLRAEWRFAPRWTMAASLNNMANKRYETVYGYNQPGREGFVTLRYSGS